MRLFYKLHRNTSVPKAWDTELNRREALISDLVYGNFFSKLVSKALGSGKNGGCRWVSQLSVLPDFLGSLLCPRAIRISKRGTQWADFSTCHNFETHINISCKVFWNLSRQCWSRVTAGLMFACAISITGGAPMLLNLFLDTQTPLYENRIS